MTRRVSLLSAGLNLALFGTLDPRNRHARPQTRRREPRRFRPAPDDPAKRPFG